MNYNITDFYNKSGYDFYSGSGSFEEKEDRNKVAKYIALSFLICFASIIIMCILFIICNELCRKLPRITICSYHSNISVESLDSTNYTINNIRKMKKEKITNKVLQFFNKKINPLYDENFDICSICLEKINPFDKDNKPFTLNCNHTYHKKCITEYVLFNAVNNININCPLCRENINIV